MKVNFFIAVGSFFLVFGTFECLARWLYGAPIPAMNPSQYAEPDPVYNHRWRKNLVYEDRARDIPYTLYTNSQRWVERYDVAAEKPPGTYRIFFLGDSNIQGVVAPDKKLVEIVERVLNAKYQQAGISIEAINTGTTSWSTMLYYLLIRHELLAYQPDLVVINVDMNDIRDDSRYRNLALFDKEGMPAAVLPDNDKNRDRYILTPTGKLELPFLLRTRLALMQVSAGFNRLSVWYERFFPVVHDVTTAMAKPIDSEADDWIWPEWTQKTEEQVRYSMEILTKAVQLLQSHGVKVYLTGVPHYPQFTGQWSTRPHDVLGETALKLGIPYLNSYESLKTRITGAPVNAYYWSSDPTHFNEQGNAAWAEEHLRFLHEHPALLPPMQ